MIVLGMTANPPTPVLAQITPAPEKVGGSSDESSSNSPTPHSHGSSSNNESSDPSSSTGDGSSDTSEGQDTSSSDDLNETAEEDSTDVSGTNDNNEGQSAIEEPNNEATSAKDVDTDNTNPLVEEIMNEVNEALSASGITGPEF